jgi:ascorbate-specific PTS system EIIC-type component UlaA
MSLFADPLKWSGSMVSSWLRFSFFAVFFVSATAFAVYSAAIDGWRSALGITFFLAYFQLMMLYALRRLYLIASGRDVEVGALTWHLLGMVILIFGFGVTVALLLGVPRAI